MNNPEQGATQRLMSAFERGRDADSNGPVLQVAWATLRDEEVIDPIRLSRTRIREAAPRVGAFG
jgi:hypothetical protein